MKNIFNLTIVILVIVLIVSLKTFSFTKADEFKTTIVKDTVAYYTNNLNIQTATINTLLLTKQQLQRDLFKKDLKIKALTKEFVKIKSVASYKTVTVVDTITVAYKDTVPYFFERSGHIKNEWFTFKYTNDNKGFQIDSLSIPTNTIIITGVKRKWFFRKTNNYN